MEAALTLIAGNNLLLSDRHYSLSANNSCCNSLQKLWLWQNCQDFNTLWQTEDLNLSRLSVEVDKLWGRNTVFMPTAPRVRFKLQWKVDTCVDERLQAHHITAG